MVQAINILTNNNLVPDSIGYYKWYCDENDYDTILTTLGVTAVGDKSRCKEKAEKKGDKYCIYLGIAKQSLRQRICKMHLNKDIQRSTLRWSIAAVFNINSCDENVISAKMNDLYVEWVEYKGTAEELESDEATFINEYFRILNDAKNKHSLNNLVSKTRKQLRRTKKYW